MCVVALLFAVLADNDRKEQASAQRLVESLTWQRKTWPVVSVVEPPQMALGEYGWHASDVVLGYTVDRKPHLVTFERDDEEGAPVVVRSACSERWDLTGTIVAWRPVPQWSGEMPGTAKVRVLKSQSPC